MTSHVTEVTDFISTHSHYAYAATFLLAFSEAIPIIGTLVPGSTLIIAISALVTRAGLNPWLLVAAAAMGHWQRRVVILVGTASTSGDSRAPAIEPFSSVDFPQ